jgi:hypothetical protein
MARSSQLPPPRSWDRRDALWPLLLLVAALLVRLWLASRNAGLTMDSPLYVRMAEELLAGRRGPSPAHHGYPMLVALASLVLPGRELPGRVVSMLASLVLVALVWRAARRRTQRPVALLPAALVALHPVLAVYAGAIMTESTFLAIAVAGILLLDAGRPRSGGALLGAAWWVRPEAAIVAPLAALLAPLRWRDRGLALLLAACVALPYTGFLRWEQGFWSLSPKTVLVRAPFASERSAEWRLADSTAFADTVSLGSRLARDGGAIVRAYPGRLARQWASTLEVWPWPLAILSAAGLLAASGRGPWLAFLALPFIDPLLSVPADTRFAQLALPALALAVMGAAERALEPPRRRWLVALAAAALAGGAWLLALPSNRASRAALAFDDGPIPAMRGAGSWIAAHTPSDAVVMDRKSYVAFFARRRHVQLPDEPLDVVLAYARSSGVTHLVVEEYVVRSLRPQLAPLLDAPAIARDPRVRIVFATRPAPGDGVAVLEVRR